MNTNMMELNMNEMELANGGLWTDDTVHNKTWSAVKAIVKGAASGSGISNSPCRPGGVMAAAIGGAMGALSALCDWMSGN